MKMFQKRWIENGKHTPSVAGTMPWSVVPESNVSIHLFAFQTMQCDWSLHIPASKFSLFFFFLPIYPQTLSKENASFMRLILCFTSAVGKAINLDRHRGNCHGADLNNLRSENFHCDWFLNDYLNHTPEMAHM